MNNANADFFDVVGGIEVLLGGEMVEKVIKALVEFFCGDGGVVEGAGGFVFFVVAFCGLGFCEEGVFD